MISQQDFHICLKRLPLLQSITQTPTIWHSNINTVRQELRGGAWGACSQGMLWGDGCLTLVWEPSQGKAISVYQSYWTYVCPGITGVERWAIVPTCKEHTVGGGDRLERRDLHSEVLRIEQGCLESLRGDILELSPQSWKVKTRWVWDLVRTPSLFPVSAKNVISVADMGFWKSHFNLPFPGHFSCSLALWIFASVCCLCLPFVENLEVENQLSEADGELVWWSLKGWFPKSYSQLPTKIRIRMFSEKPPRSLPISDNQASSSSPVVTGEGQRGREGIYVQMLSSSLTAGCFLSCQN